MDITVRIDAPELVGAINTLAAALEAGNFKLTQAAIANPVNAPAPAAVMPAAPVTVQPANPIVAPTAPMAAPVPAAAQTVAPVQAAAPLTAVSVASQTVATAPVAPVVPTAAPAYSLEQLAVAATQLVDAGRRTDLVNLLHNFGVEALTGLPKERYGEFANALRQMGAKL